VNIEFEFKTEVEMRWEVQDKSGWGEAEAISMKNPGYLASDG
jgi:hypothetical protein